LVASMMIIRMTDQRFVETENVLIK